MIWSDMYFNLLANDYQGQLYNVNADFSDDNMDKIPDGVQFVYWDYGKTWTTSHPALCAVKNKGLKEVFSTASGDNGNETNHYVILAVAGFDDGIVRWAYR